MVSGVSGPGNAVMLMLEQHLKLIPIDFACFLCPVVELIRTVTHIRESCSMPRCSEVNSDKNSGKLIF